MELYNLQVKITVMPPAFVTNNSCFFFLIWQKNFADI